MKDINKIPLPPNTAQVRYIENPAAVENKIPTLEQIQQGTKLPKGYIQELLNPQAKFPSEIIVQMRGDVDWCSNCRKWVCPFIGCSHRTPLKKCSKEECITWIPGGGYCDRHKPVVASGFPWCSNYTPSYSSSSYSSPTYYCPENGCSTSVSSSGSYCSNHQASSCNYCSTTIPRGQSYCNSHANRCNSCDTRIARGQNYCSPHQPQACLNCQRTVQLDSFYSFRNYNYSFWRSDVDPQDFCSLSCMGVYADKPWWERDRLARQRTNQSSSSSPTEQTSPSPEQLRLQGLVKNRTSISGQIKEVVRFAAPHWNNNLATAVNNEYYVFLLVYDSEDNSVKVFPTNASESKWGTSNRSQHNALASAQGEADWLRNRMVYESNPILYVHPKANEYTYFSNLITSPYVKIDCNASQSDFKPLDIVWVEKSNCGKSYYHAGVYLGNGELIEYTNDYKSGLVPSDEDIIKSLPNFLRGGITQKTSWSGFLKGKKGNIRRYHPIIPFKDYKEISAQLVWAKDTGFWKDRYNLANRNCQHFSNMAVLGINYSQEIESEKGWLIAKNVGHAAVRGIRTGVGTAATVAGIALAPLTGGLSLIPAAITGASTVVGVVDCVEKAENGDFETNNGKGSTIKLTAEQQESNSKLGKKTGWETNQLEARAEQAMPSYIPSDSCRIM